MQEYIQTGQRQAILEKHLSKTAGSSLFTAVLMLVVGYFVYRDLEAIGGTATYASAVSLFPRVLQAGGVALLVTAGLCWVGWRTALWLQAGVSGLVALVLGIIGIVWVANGDLQGLVVLLFAGAVGYSAWQDFHAARVLLASGAASSTEQMLQEATPRDGQSHEVSASSVTGAFPPLKSEAPPADDPADGYLAELGRQPSAKDDQ